MQQAHGRPLGVKRPQVVIGYLNQFHCCGAPARAEGVGMGLAICRGIVEGLGGTIRVEPPLRGGATFVVGLPTIGPSPEKGGRDGRPRPGR
jgi:K+-sensing histidine kinase KdpD